VIGSEVNDQILSGCVDGVEFAVCVVVRGKGGHHAEDDMCGCVDARTRSRGRKLAAGRRTGRRTCGGVLFC
jgi:hypothetical protein